MIKTFDAHRVVFENFQAIIQEEQLLVSVTECDTYTDCNGDKQVSFCVEFEPLYENRISEALNKAVSISINIICED